MEKCVEPVPTLRWESPLGSQVYETKEALKKAFRQWLQTYNYTPDTIKYLVQIIDEWRAFLDHQNIDTLMGVNAKTMIAYIQYLQRNRPLKNSTINNKIYALSKLSEFLLKNHQIILPIHTRYLDHDKTERQILSRSEIEKLYQVTALSTVDKNLQKRV